MTCVAAIMECCRDARGGEVAQTERIYKLSRMMEAGGLVTPRMATRALEVSVATVKRDIQHLRHRLNAPVVWSRDRGGWTLDRTQPAHGKQYELPGFWLQADEVHALLTMQHLLANLDAGGLLAPHIEPLRRRLAQMLDGGAPPRSEVARRIRVQTVGARRVHLLHFQALGSALLRRKRAFVRYHSRSGDQLSERELSPQRLVHYRDNWYLDAWCHARAGLRSFSVDAVRHVEVLDHPALDVTDHELDGALGAGYGIFGGAPTQRALLRFSPHRARWVSAERWHADQLGRWDASGNWLLTVPYADPRELVMDILRHVPDVEVLAPAELRDQVVHRLREGLTRMLDE
jgi:predicted DNA-binding transcriptional regulator YafY